MIRENWGDDMPARYLLSFSLSLQEIRRLESFTVMKEKHLNLSSQKCVWLNATWGGEKVKKSIWSGLITGPSHGKHRLVSRVLGTTPTRIFEMLFWEALLSVQRMGDPIISVWDVMPEYAINNKHWLLHFNGLFSEQDITSRRWLNYLDRARNYGGISIDKEFWFETCYCPSYY